jgi:hypothetical protein
MALDGLIEGPLPDSDEAADTLNDWVHFSRQLGLNFKLDMDGNMFSLLADNAPFSASQLGPEPEGKVGEALEQLAEALSGPGPNRIFSTLRSVRYEPGEEVQAVYAMKPDGSVDVEQRSVEADTTEPAPPLSLKEKVQAGLIAVGILALVFGVTAFFVPYGQLWDRLVNTVTPTRVTEMDVDAGPLRGLLTFKPKEVKGDVLWVEVDAGEGYPADEAALEAAWQAARTDPRMHLALESVMSGYVRCEMFDQEGKCVAIQSVRISLPEDDKPQVAGVTLPRGHRVVALRFTN